MWIKKKNVSLHDHVKVESKIPVKKQSKSRFIGIIVVSLVILNHIVFKSILKNLGVNNVFLGKMN
jgi:ABC-type uncharacterized transport system permease subunit